MSTPASRPAGEGGTALPRVEPAARIALRNLRFAWRRDGADLLRIDRFEVGAGERVFLAGPSGSGKSTLLGLLGGVLVPAAGEVRLLGTDLAPLPARRRDRFRADHVGFVFQMFNLLPWLSMRDNVTLGCRFSASRAARAARRTGSVAGEALRLLDFMELASPRLLARPVTELSIGQQQRVAVARALIGGPEVVIADEPTSALDADARSRFLELLFAECEAAGSTLLFVSHDPALAGAFSRTLRMAELAGGVAP